MSNFYMFCNNNNRLDKILIVNNYKNVFNINALKKKVKKRNIRIIIDVILENLFNLNSDNNSI